jgi:D-alanyl-lipoteichoic acid acyltransferase DltB (MBOAT superfamily)
VTGEPRGPLSLGWTFLLWIVLAAVLIVVFRQWPSLAGSTVFKTVAPAVVAVIGIAFFVVRARMKS